LAGLNNPDRWKSHFGEYDVPSVVKRSPSKYNGFGSTNGSPVVKRLRSADLSVRSDKHKRGGVGRHGSPGIDSEYPTNKKQKTMKFKKRKDT
jgi:hypothetical protein